MYNVSANFHTLSIQDAPNTRVRIYFIGDGVDCTDDNDVTTNGTLLVGAVGDTDSNGRIGQDGIKFTEYYNPEYNVTIGRAVSSQVEMTLLNTDGALDNFTYGRCKIYLDVYDSANSTWLSCPMGVYIIDLPTRRKSQLIHAFGYDQMQKLDGICDTWWAGLNFSGGLTLLQIVNSMASQTGVSVSTATASAIVNSSVTYTAAPFDCVETTYREVLELIAEATGTVARFDRDGALDLKWFKAAKISGNTVEIDTDTIGNQCLSIDIAEYQVAAIDLLKVKIAEDDVGVTVGSGTNQYTILDNLFLDGSVATITTRATAIYNRLNALGAYKPIQSNMIWDWSIEAGDIIDITRDSTTYTTPIFQQTMTWRGGYVVSELVNSGDNVRPVPNYDERSTYRMQSEMSAKVGDNEIISRINQSPEAITIQASKVDLTGYVTFTNLSTPGQTVIDGGNLVTGTVTANKLDAADINASKTLTVGAMTDAAAATILNSNVQIGGRNLCTGTAVSKQLTPENSYFSPYGIYSISAYGGAAIADTANTQYTASFDYTITGVDEAFDLTISPRTASTLYAGGFVVAKIPLGNSSGHAEGTGTITAGARQYAGTSGVLLAGEGVTNNRNVVLTISNLKFEIGNKDTSWTQAPEDVAADIATAQSAADGANLQEQLIYISEPSGTTTVAANTTWVTNTSGSQNTWTLKRPEYNSSYPVLFVATQRKAVDGTVTCTTPMVDLTTTVIDGGHITTGTIDAGVVNVTNVNASNISSGTLSAARIAAGSLSIGKLDSAAQNTINGANSQEQLIYRSKVAGTTTLSGTTSWVTNTTGNQDTWTLKRPTYNSSYPVLFVATQRKDVGGTVTCTTPQIDNTTTVIDGGHITTGTIDASVVSVTNLNASNITSGSLSANYIQGGTMTVGGLNDTNGYIRILDSTGNYAGGVGASGITLQGEEPYSGLSHVIYNALFPYGHSLRDQTTQKQLINVDVQIPSATDEYAKYYIQGYDSGTQVSRVEFSAYPYNNGAYLILQGQNGLIRLNSDGTYAGDLTLTTGNLTVGSVSGGVLDVVPRRCSGTISSAGWYRVMRFSNANSYYLNGGIGAIINFHIARQINLSGSDSSENHSITLNLARLKTSFSNENSVCGAQYIDQIRYNTSSTDGYVDIHVTGTFDMAITVQFDVYTASTQQSMFTAQALQGVGPSPSGETEVALYNFAGNLANNVIGPLVASIQPSDYPLGVSVFETGSSSTFPKTYGTVATFKQSNSRGFQLNVGYDGTVAVRAINSGAWNSWKYLN